MANSVPTPKNKLIKLRLPLRRKRSRSRPRGQITAIDVEGDILRVVQTYQRNGRTRVSRVAVEQLDISDKASLADPDILGRAIAKALAHLRVKPAQVVMGVPRALVVLRTLSLPAIDNVREVASLVHFQIAKDLPFNMDQAVIDFKVLRSVTSTPAGTNSSGSEAKDAKESAETQPKLDVLVAAANREVIGFYEKTAAAAGFKLMALGFRPYANARCVEACRIAGPDESVAFVTLRPDEVLVDVIAQQDLVFSRGTSTKLDYETAATAYVTDGQLPEPELPADPEQLTPEAAASLKDSENSLVEAITIEVVRSFHGFGGMEVKNPVSRLVLAGATGHENVVVEALRKRLNIPCELMEPARALDLPLEARGYASGAIAALGLGLSIFDPQGLPFDFLNPKRPAVRRNLRRIKLLSGIAAAALLAVTLGGIEFYLLRQKNRERDALQAQLKVEEGRHDLYRRMRIQALGIKNWLDGGQSWLDHYAYLSSVLPSCQEVYITALSISSRGSINLAVQSRSGEVLAKLEKQLSEAGYQVQPLAIKPGRDKFDYPFRSSVELIIPDQLKIDLSKLNVPPRPEDDASLDSGTKGGGS